MYKNKDEIKELYNYAFTNQNYIHIAEKGYELSKKHTYTERIKKLIKNI